jgi:hypothetical protein
MREKSPEDQPAASAPCENGKTSPQTVLGPWRQRSLKHVIFSTCMCVCVCEREREREIDYA